MKTRPKGFLGPIFGPDFPEVADYIRELHTLLWEIVKVYNPGASGDLDGYLSNLMPLIQQLERNRLYAVQELRDMEQCLESIRQVITRIKK